MNSLKRRRVSDEEKGEEEEREEEEMEGEGAVQVVESSVESILKYYTENRVSRFI